MTVTDLIRDILHWLPVCQRVRFKCNLLAHKGLHSFFPSCIADYCVRKDTTQNRYSLRTSASTRDNLIVPDGKTQFGERSFAIAGQKVWNSLPNIVKNAESVETFKSRLKTHLFKLAYDV